MPGVIVRFSIGRSATAALSEVAVRRLTSLPAATPPPSSGTRSSQPPSFLVNALRLIPTRSFTSGAEMLAPADQLAAPFLVEAAEASPYSHLSSTAEAAGLYGKVPPTHPTP